MTRAGALLVPATALGAQTTDPRHRHPSAAPLQQRYRLPPILSPPPSQHRRRRQSRRQCQTAAGTPAREASPSAPCSMITTQASRMAGECGILFSNVEQKRWWQNRSSCRATMAQTEAVVENRR